MNEISYFVPFGLVFRVDEGYEDDYYVSFFIVSDKGFVKLSPPLSFDNYDHEQNDSIELEPGELAFISVDSIPENISETDNIIETFSELELTTSFTLSLGEPKLEALVSFLLAYGNKDPEAIEFLQDLFEQCIEYHYSNIKEEPVEKNKYISQAYFENPAPDFAISEKSWIFPDHSTIQ